MNDQNVDLRQWQVEADAIRIRLAPPGVTDPEQRRQLSGLELLRGIAEGKYPRNPIGDTLDQVPITMDAGSLVYQAEPTDAYYNLSGTVHGGWLATLLDTCVGSVVLSTLQAGKGYATIELKVNYVRALTAAAGPVRAIGKSIHTGGRIGTAEGRVVDSKGRLYAHATTTCLIFDL